MGSQMVKNTWVGHFGRFKPFWTTLEHVQITKKGPKAKKKFIFILDTLYLADLSIKGEEGQFDLDRKGIPISVDLREPVIYVLAEFVR